MSRSYVKPTTAAEIQAVRENARTLLQEGKLMATPRIRKKQSKPKIEYDFIGITPFGDRSGKMPYRQSPGMI